MQKHSNVYIRHVYFVASLIALLSVFGNGAVFAETLPPQTSKVAEIALWPGTAPGSENAPAFESVVGGNVSGIAHPTLTSYFAAKPNGAAVMIMPGGGYTKLVIDKEGTEIAHWLNTLGIDAFVLKYRLPNEGHTNGNIVPLQDAQRAMRLIRSGAAGTIGGHAIDPKRIGVMGFSAGGNLAAVLGTYYDEATYAPFDSADALSARPDFMVLGYALVPTGNQPSPRSSDPRTVFVMSHIFEKRVTAKTPPAFVFAGNLDEKVPYVHSVRIAQALQTVGVQVELHIFPLAPHGFALRGTGEEKVWPELCAAWLRARGVIPAGDPVRKE